MFGIRNCDTVKKARIWLDAAGVEYRFHDYKKEGIERERLARWCAVIGWERLLNRSGTTFRKLPDAAKDSLDQARAIELMAEQPSVIRRPVVEHGEALIVGFNLADYADHFGRTA